VVDLEISLKTVSEHQKQAVKAARPAAGILKMTRSALHKPVRKGDVTVGAVATRPHLTEASLRRRTIPAAQTPTGVFRLLPAQTLATLRQKF